LPFLTRQVQGRTKEHPDGMNDKLQTVTNISFTNKQSISFNVSSYVCFG